MATRAQLVAVNDEVFGILKQADAPEVAHAGGGGNNGGMEPRVKALEDAMVTVRDRLTKIETRLENMPTKADLSDAVHTQTKWVIGIGFALMMAGITIAKLL